MTVALEFENVSKRYRLGEVGTGTISRDLERAWARFRGKPDPFSTVGVVNNREVTGGEDVWALRNINFSVSQGEIIGIIGRNGAGKSTLLKLLSRITAPTEGRIKTRGRVASLLEVGTGFHPELTGRENIYLNGAILGMSRAEIRRRFDQIVDFSGCSKYIDTPVKRYSSGMQVRLGFAVAAHLDCEILVVDEVLAVGDAEFQKRCLARLQEVATEDGRSVLFVSHNMVSVSRLCDTGLLLDQGMVSSRSDIKSVVDDYGKLALRRTQQSLADRSDRSGNGRARVLLVDFSSDDNSSSICSGACVKIGATVEVDAAALIDIHIGVRDAYGTLVTHLAATTSMGSELQLSAAGQHRISFVIPELPLAEGSYTLTTYVMVDGDVADWVQEAVEMEVSAGDFFGTGKSPLTLESRLLVAHKVYVDS